MVKSCPICASDDVQDRCMVSCPKCNQEVCHKCVVDFVKTVKDEITCMSCKHPWDRSFIFRSLPASIVHSSLKSQRESVLFEKEKILLPATSQLIPLAKAEKEILLKRAAAKDTLKKLKAEISEMDILLEGYSGEKDRIEREMEGLNIGDAKGPSSSKKIEEKEKNQVVCGCPQKDCRGFIFKELICNLCTTKICGKCHMVVDATDAKKHTCKKEDVDSVELIKKECKACPGCGVPCRKTEGCSQVWCMICKKAWNWNTSKIETGPVHATDYFLFMKKNGQAIPPYGGGGCQRVNPAISLPRLQKLYPNVMTTEKVDFITRRYQLSHEDIAMIERQSNLDLRIKYLNKEITEERWKQILHKRDKAVTFKAEIYRMRNAYRYGMQDAVAAVCNASSEKALKNAVVELEKFNELMMTEYEKLAKCFISSRACPFA